ncbi:MAG: glutamate-cysteine ligase family protein [Zavarzinella sp.]
MKYHLFDVVGIELEYMVVNATSGAVVPAVFDLLADVNGQPSSDWEHEPISWSNELAAHVVEFKTTQPQPAISPLVGAFHAEVQRANQFLQDRGCCLLPTAMHPWMDPTVDSGLWPGEGSEIYQTFDRLFNCRSHGWLNLQSMHINLPFTGDEEFDRLHSAIRLVLPLLPALAASSPYKEGKATGFYDSRLLHYRTHCAQISVLTGSIVPEPISSQQEYEDVVYQPIRAALPTFDPSGTLRAEWSNARGAIARFDRGSIEIRLIDLQENPRMDLAIATLVVETVKHLIAKHSALEMRQIPTDQLVTLFQHTIQHAGATTFKNENLMRIFGVTASCTVLELWEQLSQQLVAQNNSPVLAFQEELEIVFRHGTLAERLVHVLGTQPSRTQLRDTYLELADCLHRGLAFLPKVAGK